MPWVRAMIERKPASLPGRAAHEPVNAMAVVLILGVMLAAAYFAVSVIDTSALRKEKLDAAKATPATWPCPLPAAEGDQSVAILTKRGPVFDVTCRDIRPFIRKGSE